MNYILYPSPRNGNLYKKHFSNTKYKLFLINDQRDAQIFSMCLYLFITFYMFPAHSAHHQVRQIVSIQPLVTVILCWWPRCVQVGRRLHTSRPPT